jgi:hypothetical protein
MTRMMSDARPGLEDYRNTINIAFPASGPARLESERVGRAYLAGLGIASPKTAGHADVRDLLPMLAFAWVKGMSIGSGAWHTGSALTDHGRHHWMGDVPATNETIIKTITKGLRWLDRQIDMIVGPAQPGPVPAPAGLTDVQVHRGSTMSERRC